jgi:hypothetical protein
MFRGIAAALFAGSSSIGVLYPEYLCVDNMIPKIVVAWVLSHVCYFLRNYWLYNLT